jgi:hypothetical protein
MYPLSVANDMIKHHQMFLGLCQLQSWHSLYSWNLPVEEIVYDT